MLMRRWTPPSQLPTVSLENNNSTGQRTCLRWCKLFISTLIALALISFCVVYPLQKENFFNQAYQRQQHDEYEKQQRLVFDNYIQDISNTLLQNPEKNIIEEKYLLHIRTKTLMILRDLDVKQKKDILVFLYERRLLQNNQLDISGADFNNVELTCSHDFHHLHLVGVQWSNATFGNCHLAFANFNQASLFNARFINCSISNSLFIETNLDHSQFIKTSVRYGNFTRATLIQANFLQANILQENQFINADLYQANLTHNQLEEAKLPETKYNFYHARFPDGSFGLIDSDENLLINGNAEMECSADNQTAWKTSDGSMTLSTNTITDNDNHWENCSFVISAKTRAYQNINLHSYSLLIDTNNGAISFIAFANCTQSIFGIQMYDSDDILRVSKTYSEPMKDMNTEANKTMHQYGEYQQHLPIHTRRIEVYFGIDEPENNMTCYFDNLALTISQQKTQ